jgi:hypothetical protein
MPLRSGAWAKLRTGCPTDNQGRSDEADLSIGQRARPHIGVVDVISERRHHVVAIRLLRSPSLDGSRGRLHDGDVRFGL